MRNLTKLCLALDTLLKWAAIREKMSDENPFGWDGEHSMDSVYAHPSDFDSNAVRRRAALTLSRSEGVTFDTDSRQVVFTKS